MYLFLVVERLEEKHEALNKQNKELRDNNIEVCTYMCEQEGKERGGAIGGASLRWRNYSLLSFLNYWMQAIMQQFLLGGVFRGGDGWGAGGGGWVGHGPQKERPL